MNHKAVYRTVPATPGLFIITDLGMPTIKNISSFTTKHKNKKYTCKVMMKDNLMNHVSVKLKRIF